MTLSIQDHFADPILDDLPTREINIDNRSNSSELTDYQVIVDVSNYVDKQGVRFVDENLQIVNYWEEDSNTIWAEIPNITGSKVSAVRLMHGDVDSMSDGDVTFDFFDDFTIDGLNTDKWELRNSPTEIDAQLECINDEFVVSKTSFDVRGKAVRWKTKIISGVDRQHWLLGDVKTTETSSPYGASGQDGYSLNRYDNIGRVRSIVNGSMGVDWSDNYYFSGFSPSNWHTIEMSIEYNSPYLTKFRIKKSIWDSVYEENWQHSDYDMYIYIGVKGTSESVTSRHDWIFVHKYTSPEPTAVIA